MLPKTLTIGGETWAVSSMEKDVLGERLGACVEDEKTIYVWDDPETRTRRGKFAVLVHEIMHARNPGLSEKATCETEDAIMEAFRKLGCR